MNKTSVPRSRATTAWGLLKAVRAAILAEPKRLNMGTWLETQVEGRGAPSCGTVGCLAGWAVVLKGKETEYGNGTYAKAVKLLGLTPDQAHDLFTPDHLVFDPGQTIRHARKTVKHLDAFMDENAEQLRNTHI